MRVKYSTCRTKCARTLALNLLEHETWRCGNSISPRLLRSQCVNHAFRRWVGHSGPLRRYGAVHSLSRSEDVARALS